MSPKNRPASHNTAKPDVQVCLRNTSQAGGLTGGAVFPTIVAEHPSAVLVHFGGSRTRDIDGNFSKPVLQWLSLYPAAVGRGSNRGVTCYYTISTDKAIQGTSSRSGQITNTSVREPSAEELVANLESLLNSVLSSGSCHSYQRA